MSYKNNSHLLFTFLKNRMRDGVVLDGGVFSLFKICCVGARSPPGLDRGIEAPAPTKSRLTRVGDWNLSAGVGD